MGKPNKVPLISSFFQLKKKKKKKNTSTEENVRKCYIVFNLTKKLFQEMRIIKVIPKL